MTRKPQKVPVTARALIQRINRRLATNGQRLKTLRGQPGAGRHDLGRYYVVDVNRNFLVNRDAELDALGRELGVLAGYEELETDEA